MRVYLPATATDLSAPELHPGRVHAVTPAVRTELSGEDEETLELVALLAAADDSVRLIAEHGAPPRRVVLAADLAASRLRSVGGEEIETLLALDGAVSWEDVVSIHVDEAAAAPRVAAAAGGDEEAFEALGEQDLLWFDVTERAAVVEGL